MNRAAWTLLAGLLAVAFFLRLAAGFYWQSRLPEDERFGFGDSESYWALGHKIAAGRPYRFDAHEADVFRTPGYPAVLATLFCVVGQQPPTMWARVQSAVLGTLTVAAVWWLACQLFDARAGIIAAAMAACYPGTVAIGALVLAEAPFCVLMLVQLSLWTSAWNAGSPRQASLFAMAAGFAAGLATLMRPSWLLFVPLAIGISILAPGKGVTGAKRSGAPKRPARLRQAWITVAMLAALAVTMAPWWIRNARITGHFVPTTLQVGASLYDGLSPSATGASDMEFVGPHTERLHTAAIPDAEAGDTFEYRLDRHFRREALTWAAEHPAQAARLAVVKLVRMWNVWPNEAAFSSWKIRLAVLLTYVPVLTLGIVGAVKTSRRGWPYRLCWLPAVYFTALHVVFVSSIRYRQPAMLGLMVLAAGVAAQWGRRKEEGGRRKDEG